MNTPPFHLAIPVNDLKVARHFYGELLQCQEGRSDKNWVDFNFFGHQLVTHYNPDENKNLHYNDVDGHGVPIPHFGVVLDWNNWEKLSIRLKSHKIKFVIPPYVRFKGKAGEQATMFFNDPFGNALEFKAFKQMEQLFAQ